jgi:hypothetical protein
MLIVFTGHRDRTASAADIHAIEAQYPGAVWMHGGAKGFDTQAHRKPPQLAPTRARCKIDMPLTNQRFNIRSQH